MARLAIVTGLCSRQRVSDCIRMQHRWIDGGFMELAQKKTGKNVAIWMHEGSDDVSHHLYRPPWRRTSGSSRLCEASVSVRQLPRAG